MYVTHSTARVKQTQVSSLAREGPRVPAVQWLRSQEKSVPRQVRGRVVIEAQCAIPSRQFSVRIRRPIDGCGLRYSHPGVIPASNDGRRRDRRLKIEIDRQGLGPGYT